MSKSVFHFVIISSNVLPLSNDGACPGFTGADAGVGEVPAVGAVVEVEAPAVAGAGVEAVPINALRVRN